MIQRNKDSWCVSSFLLFFSLILLQICLFLCVYVKFLQTHWRLLGYRAKNAEYGWFSDLFMPTKPLSLSLSHNWNYTWDFHCFFFFQFIVSLKNVVKSFELLSWVSFLLDCQQKALKYLALNPPLRNYFDLEKHHHQILHWLFFSPILNVLLLKEKQCDLACWFCVWFFFKLEKVMMTCALK